MLKISVKSLLLVSALSVAGLAAPALAATSTVNVSLADAGAAAPLGTDLGISMKGDHATAVMHVIPDKTEVPAGEVTFKVTNNSSDIVHEMLVVKVADANQPLPYVDGESRVDEDAAGHLGEVSELDPGDSGSLTLSLDSGTYMLFCNIPGHYQAGMWTLVTVN
ncbi:MAG: hypothetical protein JWQ89_267 [Devosia sp.]|uniref:plastocyanin/azurin family copper-binding protein n=1 Tax=Devosia sp. TaxID=1871048 RepID=UPI002604A569|nr:plastocyanin/azurin family copper-binding protein [Devosia sp.]MDB5538540.1 hypothetical protein [Devosia sp.]